MNFGLILAAGCAAAILSAYTHGHQRNDGAWVTGKTPEEQVRYMGKFFLGGIAVAALINWLVILG